MSELVVYREFDDGTDEIGVLTYEDNGFWIHVGDFDYFLSWGRYLPGHGRFFNWPFIIIGEL